MSTATIATILLLGVFLVLVFLRVPVVYAIGVASLLDFFYLGINPMQMALKFVSNLNSYTLLAVPFFILMGELMSAGGITDTLIAFSKELVGWMHGGAAMVNVVASFFFGGISGSSSADCASLGPIEIKMMEEQGYDREFNLARMDLNNEIGKSERDDARIAELNEKVNNLYGPTLGDEGLTAYNAAKRE